MNVPTKQIQKIQVVKPTATFRCVALNIR